MASRLIGASAQAVGQFQLKRFTENLAWRIEFDPSAAKEFAALDRPVQLRIKVFLDRVVAADPRHVGAALKGPYRGYWKYRVGD